MVIFLLCTCQEEKVDVYYCYNKHDLCLFVKYSNDKWPKFLQFIQVLRLYLDIEIWKEVLTSKIGGY